MQSFKVVNVRVWIKSYKTWSSNKSVYKIKESWMKCKRLHCLIFFLLVGMFHMKQFSIFLWLFHMKQLRYIYNIVVVQKALYSVDIHVCLREKYKNSCVCLVCGCVWLCVVKFFLVSCVCVNKFLCVCVFVYVSSRYKKIKKRCK